MQISGDIPAHIRIRDIVRCIDRALRLNDRELAAFCRAASDFLRQNTMEAPANADEYDLRGYLTLIFGGHVCDLDGLYGLYDVFEAARVGAFGEVLQATETLCGRHAVGHDGAHASAGNASAAGT